MSSTHITSTQRQILIVDSHPLVQRGLTELINGEPDLNVCATTATHDEALNAIYAHQPDLVVTELMFDDEDGLELVKDIRSTYEDLPVLVLSLHDAPQYAKLARQAGAIGYVSKREMTETLLVAIRRALLKTTAI